MKVVTAILPYMYMYAYKVLYYFVCVFDGQFQGGGEGEHREG